MAKATKSSTTKSGHAPHASDILPNLHDHALSHAPKLHSITAAHSLLLLHLLSASPTNNPRIPIPQMLQQPTPLEIRIRMHNSIQITPTPTPILLHLVNLLFVTPFKYAIARNMVPLLAHVLLDHFEHIAIIYANALKHREQVVRREGAVRTPVGLSRTG